MIAKQSVSIPDSFIKGQQYELAEIYEQINYNNSTSKVYLLICSDGIEHSIFADTFEAHFQSLFS